MNPIADTGQFDDETQSTLWVTKEQARELILLTSKPKRRRRDLRVLRLAFRLFYELRTSDSPVAPAFSHSGAAGELDADQNNSHVSRIAS